MPISRKGLRSIRTMTVALGKIPPQKAYIGAAVLEMEKRHHMHELQTLRHRMDELNSRVKKIKEEQGKLTSIFLDNNEQMQCMNKKDGLKSNSDNNPAGFKIKY